MTALDAINHPAPPDPTGSAADLATIVEFNRLLALETEAKVLDPAILESGVACALADPDRLRYWVAEVGRSRAAGRPGRRHPRMERLAQGLDLVVPERLRRPDFRGRGVFRALHHQIRDEARSLPDVIGLRLYVEDANHPAQRTYQALGMKPGGYSVYEDLWIPGSDHVSGDGLMRAALAGRYIRNQDAGPSRAGGCRPIDPVQSRHPDQLHRPAVASRSGGGAGIDRRRGPGNALAQRDRPATQSAAALLAST